MASRGQCTAERRNLELKNVRSNSFQPGRAKSSFFQFRRWNSAYTTGYSVMCWFFISKYCARTVLSGLKEAGGTFFLRLLHRTSEQIQFEMRDKFCLGVPFHEKNFGTELVGKAAEEKEKWDLEEEPPYIQNVPPSLLEVTLSQTLCSTCGNFYPEWISWSSK